MTRQALESLKTHLVQATDLAPVLSEFFDLAEEPDFMDQGQRVCDPVLEEIVRATALRLGGQVENLLLVRVAEHGFVHGGFTVGRRMGSLFFFEEVRRGLAAAVDEGTGDTRIARFTASRPMPATPGAN